MSSAVGIMAVKIDKASPRARIKFLYGHTTDSMVFKSFCVIQSTFHILTWLSIGNGSYDPIYEGPRDYNVPQ